MSTPNCPPPTTSVAFATVRRGLEAFKGGSSQWSKATDGLTAVSLLERRMGALAEAARELNAVLADVHQDPDELANARDALESALADAEPASDAEDLADALDREHRAHEQTRQALVEATRELERLRPVETAARAVLGVCDAATGVAQTEERLQQLDSAIENLRVVLGDVQSAPVREAELRAAAEPFLALARDRLARRSWEPISDAACLRFLCAFDNASWVTLVVGVDTASGPDMTVTAPVPRAPPEAFTRKHAIEDDMPGLPSGEDGNND